MSKITIYHRLFLGFLGGSLAFFAAAVVLFIRLKIGSVWGFLTGSAARREIRRREITGAFREQTERLRSRGEEFRIVREIKKIHTKERIGGVSE